MSDPTEQPDTREPIMEPQVTDATPPPVKASPRPKPSVPLLILAGVALVLGGGFWMYKRSSAKTNQNALSSEAKPVTVVEARTATFRPTRRYVATIQPWLQAKVGPQLVSAYVDTVLFRPGAVVHKGDVLATLDCRNASAGAQSVAMMARALETKQAAAAKEAARIQGMLDGGFVSQNEADKKIAEATAQEADILAAKAKLLGTSLEVNDCIMRAPFDGEVSERSMDPGAFAKPGLPILSLVERTTVRIAADVPETEFGLIAPGTVVKVRIVATGRLVSAPIVRRSPNADAFTRTVHFEVDLADPTHEIPVGTTAELTLDFGAPRPAAELPLLAATIRGEKATIFALEGDVAKKRTVDALGESGGSIYLDPSLVGQKIVTEGRALLDDGDKVTFKVIPFASTTTTAAVPAPSTSGSAVKPGGAQ